jgi:hypothetical protein
VPDIGYIRRSFYRIAQCDSDGTPVMSERIPVHVKDNIISVVWHDDNQEIEVTYWSWN